MQMKNGTASNFPARFYCPFLQLNFHPPYFHDAAVNLSRSPYPRSQSHMVQPSTREPKAPAERGKLGE